MEENKINKPVTQPIQAETGNLKSSKAPWVVLGIVVLVIVILGVLFRDKLFGSRAENTGADQAAGSVSDYQAVFLTNGQVYFGKISDLNAAFVTMTDIYYLQVVQPPLQGQQDPNNRPGQQPQQQQEQEQAQISLVKLGNELHGPVDEMKINKDHILFYEDLKNEGQVVQAIINFKAAPQQ